MYVPIAKVELPSKEAAAAESPRLRGANFLMYPSENQRECEASGITYIHTLRPLATSQGLTLARCCIQIKPDCDGLTHNIDNVNAPRFPLNPS